MTDSIDTPEEVRAILAQLGGPNSEFYSGEAADMLRSYAELLEQHVALKARVEELEKQLTVTDDRDRTHSAECWKWHRHHACAIARAERLEAQIAALQARLPGDER